MTRPSPPDGPWGDVEAFPPEWHAEALEALVARLWASLPPFADVMADPMRPVTVPAAHLVLLLTRLAEADAQASRALFDEAFALVLATMPTRGSA